MVKESIWNDNLVSRLKDLYLNKNMTAIDIGNELGFSKNAIIGKIHRLQLNVLKENTPKGKKVKLKTNTNKQSQKESLSTIKPENIKGVINIAKKSNTIIENIENLEEKVQVVQNISNLKDFSKEDKDIDILEDSLSSNEVSKDVFKLNKNSPDLIGKYKLADIEFNMCVWPYGEEDFSFCGAKTLTGKSYCQEHLDLVYFVTKKVSKKKYASIEDEVEVEIDDTEVEELEDIEITL